MILTAIGISWAMVRGVEVNGSIAMTHSVIVRARTTVRFVKGASRSEAERPCTCAQAKPSSKFEIAQLSLSSILEGRFVVLTKL
jgi:hypothetical protein